MNKLKVTTVVGTRPEIIRLSRIMHALDKHFEHLIVHTGQNYDYELNQLFFDDLDLRKPDKFLDAAGKTAAETIGNIIARMDQLLSNSLPDALLVLGDTNSCLAAYAAKRLKIPVFHMEAGNRCFDQRVPEEINRKVVDHISDINLCYSAIAREYLLREGLSPDFVIKTGSPMLEVIQYYRSKIDASPVLQTLDLEASPYFLVSSHREENINSVRQFSALVNSLNCLARDFNFRVIFTTHPRTRKQFDSAAVKLDPRIELLKPLSFTEYVKLQLHAVVVLSDSGTISEDSSILNFPALNIREAHERPEAMEEGSVMFTGLEYHRIRQGIEILETQASGTFRTLSPVIDYSSPNVSEKVVRIILSYTDYVKRNVWRVY